MRSIVIGAIVAAGLSLVTAVPTVSAPANVAVIGQATAELGTVTQARWWGRWRGWGGARARSTRYTQHPINCGSARRADRARRVCFRTRAARCRVGSAHL